MDGMSVNKVQVGRNAGQAVQAVLASVAMSSALRAPGRQGPKCRVPVAQKPTQGRVEPREALGDAE